MKKRNLAKIIIMSALIITMLVPVLMPSFSNAFSAYAATQEKINKKKITLYSGETYNLNISGTTKSVKWSSSKAAVAAVTSEGKVTAVKKGTAIITAKVNSKKYTCKVTVKATTTVYGKVTAVNGKKVTLALGTLNEGGGTPPSGTPGAQQNTSGGSSITSSTTATSTTVNSASGVDSDSSKSTQSGSQPTSQPGGAPELLTLTGKTVTITISDTSILFKQSGQTNQSTVANSNASASLSDVTVGSILKITYKKSVKDLASILILGAGQGGGSNSGGPQSGGTTGGSTSVTTGTGAYNLKDGEAISGGTYTSTNADENAIRAENKITASLDNVTVSKTAGAASSNDGSSFYGLDAAILALGSSTLNITGGSVTANAEGSNGVFAYDGATINIKDTKIDVTGGNSGGIEVAGGGIMNATNLTVNSSNKAAIRSDRGGGTMNVNGGTYTTAGSSGAPAVYSTAAITVNDATLTANNSEAIVVEGLNSVALNNCNVTGNMSGTYGSDSGENIHNVMLYQSMSGDAQVGNSSFTMTGGTLTSKNGDMFYVTNTDSVIKLSDVKLNLADNTNLLVVAGNDGTRGWGTAGSNGGNCTLETAKQTLTGNITVDKISKLSMSLKDSSSFTGAINSDGTTASTLSVTLDSSSTWTMTGDSYITEFNGSMSNVNTNGHTLYVNGVAMK